MARSQHIPAKFEMGFSLPSDKSAGEIAGYHCWAEFFNSQNGWVPVDISEAWKHQEKRDYFFGAQLRFTDEDLKSILPFAPVRP